MARSPVFRALLALLGAALSLGGCDRAVPVHTEPTYRVEGDSASVLYPSKVEQKSENVLIFLRSGAPLPEVLQVDASGRETPYAFSAAGNILVVPAKFQHLRLRHEGAPSIDLIQASGGK